MILNILLHLFWLLRVYILRKMIIMAVCILKISPLKSRISCKSILWLRTVSDNDQNHRMEAIKKEERVMVAASWNCYKYKSYGCLHNFGRLQILAVCTFYRLSYIFAWIALPAELIGLTVEVREITGYQYRVSDKM